MNHRNKFLIPFFASILIVVGIVIGNVFSRHNEFSSHQNYIVPANSNRVKEVIDIVNSQYVDEVSMDDIETRAIKAIIDSLDPHSVYIPADELKAVNEPLEGKFSGIGVQFNMQNDTIIIIKTIYKGPSEKIGIRAGDRIITVDDTLVAGVKLPSDQIVKKLKGVKGTSVKVGILRNGLPSLLYFNIVRDDIPILSVDIAYMLNAKTGYIKINSFGRTTYDEFMSGIASLNKSGMKNLVLDLRSNGGGYMDPAIEIADQFLSKNQMIVYTEGKAMERKEIFATSKGDLHELPLVVLIDEYSASASEILAGAIQDHDRGLIIGRRSFGKGLVQQQMDLMQGDAIRLTIAHYYTPLGRNIQKPYTNKEEYFSEVNERYNRGEFFSSDSIRFADSLVYTTPKGKKLYGGGGIMPDIFIPQDTSYFSEFYINVSVKGLIYKFSFDYADNHRERLSKLKNAEEFDKHLTRENVYYQFKLFAEKQGLKYDTSSLKSKEAIEIQLKAYIARNIIDDWGYYPIIHKIDNTLLRAVKELSQE